MLGHIGNVRQAVKFAVSDLPPGRDELPGFCLPKKVLNYFYSTLKLNGDGFMMSIWSYFIKLNFYHKRYATL